MANSKNSQGASYKLERERNMFIDWMELRGLSETSIKDYLFYYDKFGGAKNLNQNYVDKFVLRYKNMFVPRSFVKNLKQFVIKNEGHFQQRGVDIQQVLRIELEKITGRKKLRIPRVLSKEEVAAIENNMNSERDKIMLLLTYCCALRRGGLLGIKPYDFNWEKWEADRTKSGDLRVIEKGNRERIVPVPNWLMERIERWIYDVATKKLPDDSHQLWMIKKHRWRDILEAASKKALGFRVNPHLLRHSAATYFYDMGWDLHSIAKLLGHSDLRATQLYAHISNKKFKEKYEKVFQEFTPVEEEDPPIPPE